MIILIFSRLPTTLFHRNTNGSSYNPDRSIKAWTLLGSMIKVTILYSALTPPPPSPPHETKRTSVWVEFSAAYIHCPMYWSREGRMYIWVMPNGIGCVYVVMLCIVVRSWLDFQSQCWWFEFQPVANVLWQDINPYLSNPNRGGNGYLVWCDYPLLFKT